MKFKYNGRHAYNLYEILNAIANEDTQEDKIKLLKFFDSKHLRWYVESLYNKDFSNIKIPKHEKPIGYLGYTNFNSAADLLDLILTKQNDEYWTVTRLSEMLESVDLDDYEIIISILQNRKNPNIHKSIFKKVYPQFFRSESDSEEV